MSAALALPFPATRAPPVQRYCACSATACYFLGPPAVPAHDERAWCPRCVPAGFLPKPPEDAF